MPGSDGSGLPTDADGIGITNDIDRQLGEVSDQPLTYSSPGQGTAGAASSVGVAAVADQYVELFVPDTEDTGIRINFGADADGTDFLIPTGASRVFRTSQAMHWIRAGATDVTVEVLTAVVA